MSSVKSAKRKMGTDTSSSETGTKKAKTEAASKAKKAAKAKPAPKASKPRKTDQALGSDEDEVAASRGGKKSYPKEIDPATNKEQDAASIKFTKPLPTRNKKGELVFADAPDLRPNMTPKEVLQAGSFGGSYFRSIKSSATDSTDVCPQYAPPLRAISSKLLSCWDDHGKSYSKVWEELPKDWLEGLSIQRLVASSTYREDVNTYGVKCGGSLEMWESSGWMHKQDPYGWFQWYCRFYQGRRTADDDRQIGRWLRCAGVTGRWRCNLISKCIRSNCAFDNPAVSPVVRQTLQHWGYRLTKEDFDAYAKKMKRK